jgi:hypothetical protein
MFVMSNSSANGSVWKKIGLGLIALIFVGWWKLSKWLHTTAYNSKNGWAWNICTGFAEAFSSLYIGIATAGLVKTGGELGFKLFGWNAYLAQAHGGWISNLFGLGAFVFTALYLFPAVWAAFVAPLWRFFKANYFTPIDQYLDKNGDSFSHDLIHIPRLLPGSDALWTKVESEQEYQKQPDGSYTKPSWFLGLEAVVVGLASFALGGWAAYETFGYVSGLVAPGTVLHAIFATVGGMLGLMVWSLISHPLFHLIDKGKARAVGFLTAVATAVFGHGLYAWLLGLAGIANFGTVWVACLAAFVFTAAYGFPLVTLAFGNRFLKRVYEALKPLFESCYDDKDTAFRRLVHGVLTLAGLGGTLYASWLLFAAINLSFGAGLLALAVVAFIAYSLIGEILDWEGGTYISGTLFSLAGGAGVLYLWLHLALPFGLLGGIIAGVLSAAANFFLLFPLTYWVLRAFFMFAPVQFLFTGWLGNGLHWLHKQDWKAFDKLATACEKVYWWGYGDKNKNFMDVASHEANIVAAGALTIAVGLTMHSFGRGLILTGVVCALVLALAYLLGRKLLFKNRIEPAGCLAGLLSAIASGALVTHLQPLGLLFAVPFGVVVGTIVYCLIFPSLYMGWQWFTDPKLTEVLLPLLNGLYDFAWSKFAWIYDGAIRLYHFLEPYLGGVIAFFAAAWNAAKGVWDSVFGGSKKAQH